MFQTAQRTARLPNGWREVVPLGKEREPIFGLLLARYGDEGDDLVKAGVCLGRTGSDALAGWLVVQSARLRVRSGHAGRDGGGGFAVSSGYAPMNPNDLLHVKAARRYGTASPLRYPGGKASLAGFFADVIGGLCLGNPTYVEPYAGGAGAGVALLMEDRVQRLVVNDFDPAVHSFWVAATQHSDALCALVENTPLTVEEWRQQKSVYRAEDDSDPLTLGFAFFYLNRTNRSGILNAGPIGGVKQDGNYKIDARFNRDELLRRLAAIGERAHRIVVSNLDGRSVVKQYAADPDAFLYVDPPYLAAGRSLYLNAFTHRDHGDLAATIRAYPTGNWVVTYDDAPYIRRLYEGEAVRSYALYYSAHNATRSTELAVLSPSVARLVVA